MKLRLRSIQSGETLRIQIPSPSTLLQLQQILSQTISSSPSSLHFSLNRKDEILAPSPLVSLQSLGVTSGDLVYYSLDRNSFVSVQPNSGPPSQTLARESNSANVDNSQELGIPDARVADQGAPVQDSEFSKENPIQEMQENVECSGPENMDTDDVLVDLPAQRMSEPYFLRVLREELGDDASSHKLLVIAVHAILVESGFVGFDVVSGKRLDHICIPDGWPSTNSAMSLRYTLPELLLNNSSGDLTESIILKFHCVGDLVNVYGSLSKDNLGHYKVSLNKNKFAYIIGSLFAHCDDKDGMIDKDGPKNLYPENEVFEFWKKVKDGLALPSLIDLCERTGLNLPACLMRLPTELKFKILESLPGVDIAKMECVCSEMRYLASNNDLWRQKFADEFGNKLPKSPANWKEKFAMDWKMIQERKKRPSFNVGMPFLPARREPFSRFRRSQRWRNFSPTCDWSDDA